jgi:septal ring-binding cell division protein DamX/type II secretory pathway predicted ATPase ExeA
MDRFDEGKLAVPPYMLEQWQRQINLIGQLAQFSNDVVCIEGERGIGKTTFVNQLASSHPTRLLCRILDASQIDSVASLMHEVADAFGLSWSGNSESPHAFSSVDPVLHGNMTWVLLVDNAHQLTPAHWQALIDLANQSDDPLQHLHLVFAGEIGFSAKLLNQVHALERKKLHCLKLECMTQEESLKFVEHVLHHQGINTNHFNQKSKKQMVALANGNPQQLMETLLPMLRSHHAIGGDVVKDVNTSKNKYLWLAVGSIVFFGLYGISQIGSEPSQNTLDQLLPTQAKTVGTPQVEAQVADPLAENLEKALASLKDKQELGDSTIEPGVTSNEIATLTATGAVTDASTNTTTGSSVSSQTNTISTGTTVAVMEPAATATTAEVTAPATEVLATQSTPSAETTAAFSAQELATIDQNMASPVENTINTLAVRDTVASSAVAEKVLPESATTTALPNTATTAKKAQAKSTVSNTTKTASAAKKLKLSAFEQRLLTQKESHYTIQILAAGQEKTVKNMMNQPLVAKQGGYYRRGQGSKQKFVFVTGAYASRAEAQDALDNLPPEIRKLNPFIRNFGKIKEEVAATSKVKSANNG